MEQEEKQLLAILRAGLRGEMPVLESPLNYLTAEEKLDPLAKVQRLRHWLYPICERTGTLPQNAAGGLPRIGEEWRQAWQQEVALIRQQEYALQRAGETLTQHGISFAPLKGAVLRKLYPEPWMRNSCDVDILLLGGADVFEASTILEQEENYRRRKLNSHDMSLQTTSDVHVELHFTLAEGHSSMDRGLNQADEWLLPAPEGQCEREFTPEFLLYHVLAHLAHHIAVGGGGVRPVMDIWLLRQRPYDEEKLDRLLEHGQLATMADVIFRLADEWFGDGEGNRYTAIVGEHLARCGLWGDDRREQMAFELRRRRMLATRTWLPTRELRLQYPELIQHPKRAIYYQMKRWARVISRPHLHPLVKWISPPHRTGDMLTRDMARVFGALDLRF